MRRGVAGEAAAILARAEATARGIELLADAIRQQGGSEAVALKVRCLGEQGEAGNAVCKGQAASNWVMAKQ